MDDNQLSQLRYALKQCEQSYRQACDDPRRWEQAWLNSDGLLDRVQGLPADERSAWEAKLTEWRPQMKAGADRAVGERILRRINDSLASAADKLADDSDPSRDVEWLERELAHPDTVACVPEAERAAATSALNALQGKLAGKVLVHRLATVSDRIADAEAALAELDAAMAEGGSHPHLARVVAGRLDTAQAEIDSLPMADTDVAADSFVERDGLVARLLPLRQRFDAL